MGTGEDLHSLSKSDSDDCIDDDIGGDGGSKTFMGT